MKTYEVTTQETINKTFRLQANSKEEAMELAENDLYDEEIEFVESETESEEIEEINEVIFTAKN